MEKSMDLWGRRCIVWETEIPYRDICRKSPCIFLEGSEWELLLSFDVTSGKSYKLHLSTVSDNWESKKAFNVTTFIQSTRIDSTPMLSWITTVDDKTNLLWSEPVRKVKENIVDFLDFGKLKIICLFHITSVLNPVPSYKTKDVSTQTNFESSDSSTDNIARKIESNLSSDKHVQVCLDERDDLDNLSIDLNNLFYNKTVSDIKLRSGGLTIQAHKAILAARSEVFSSMFEDKMSKNSDGIFDIADMEAPVLKLFLKYIYSGCMEDMSEETASSLYMASDKYSVEALKSACSDWIYRRLTVGNCLKFLVLTDKCNDEYLKNSIIKRISINLQDIGKESWSEFSKEFPKLSNSVYQMLLGKVLSKQE